MTTPTDVRTRVERALAGPVMKAMKRKRPLPAAAIEDLQLGALQHDDPQVRTWCVFVLDHFANDQSMPVFAEALKDETLAVRNLALHSIACEPCKSEELCVGDAVPHVIRVLESDPIVDLRIKAIPALLAMAGRDERARAAISRTAREDPDPLVRKCARDALDGYFVAPKKRYERSQRRHASVHHR